MLTPKDPFDGLVLDAEEQAIEEALERGEYEDEPNFEESKKMLMQAAKQYRKANKLTLRHQRTINQLKRPPGV